MYFDDEKNEEELEEQGEGSTELATKGGSMDASGMDEGQEQPKENPTTEGIEGEALPESENAEFENQEHDLDSGSAPDSDASAQDQSPGTYSAVSLAANKRKFLIIAVLAAAIGVLYFVFTSTGKSKDGPEVAPKLTPTQVERAISDSTPVTRDIDSSQSTSIPRAQLPEFSQLQEPEPPAPPPPPEPEIPQTPFVPGSSPGGGPAAPGFNTSGGTIFEKRSEEANEVFLAKRGESIMVLGGASSTGFGTDGEKKEGEEEAKEKKDNSGFLGFGDGQIDGDTFSKTSSTQVKATRIGNLSNMIAQGKMISAVLETAINTDIPGTLRAVVSRDVYSESGKRVLIPKGSRLIGEYEPEVKNGQTRVPIVWSRVILPNGFDVALGSPGTDRLGRAGVAGKLHNKFWTRLASAFLVSFVLPYGAYKLSDVGSSSTTSSSSTAADGTTTSSTTGDTESQLVADSAQKFADIATEIVQSNFSEEPTIIINQGERVKVFVNKDIIFPSHEYMNRYSMR